ncbi:MAG TPA: hypothetical protein VKB68_01925 [Stellaceae bacterium]|nr:hypothetical protein [Stellaceae bacterium]
MRRLSLIALGAICATATLAPRPADAAQACDQWVGRYVTLTGTVHWRNFDPDKFEYSIVLQGACASLVNIYGSGALPCPNSRSITVIGLLEEASEDAILLAGEYVIFDPERVECR